MFIIENQIIFMLYLQDTQDLYKISLTYLQGNFTELNPLNLNCDAKLTIIKIQEQLKFVK